MKVFSHTGTDVDISRAIFLRNVDLKQTLHDYTIAVRRFPSLVSERACSQAENETYNRSHVRFSVTT